MRIEQAIKELGPEATKDGKQVKRIVSLPSDVHRGLVNIHHVQSFKEYNASPDE